MTATNAIRRLYQQTALREFVRSDARFWALLWERQSGKSTTFADFALYEMLKYKNRTVIYGSASLLLAQELPIKTAIRANQSISQIVESDAAILKQFAETAQSTIDAQNQNIISPSNPFKNLLTQLEIEKRLKRNKHFIRTIERHRCTSWRAASGSSNRFPYPQAQSGIQPNVQFKTYDASTGKEIIGGKGASAKHISADAITPAEAFTRAPNKDGHRIAHWLTWMLGGSAACDLLRLRTAQERGLNLCQNFQITTDADMVPASNWLYNNLGRTNASPSPGGEGRGEGELKKLTNISSVHGEGELNTDRSSLLTRHSSPRLALGFDVATTTKGKSNPSVLSLMEERGPEWLVRARFIWRASDPETANHRIETILDTRARCGIRPKALAQDATNERYYGEQNLKRFRRRLPVILVVASQSVDKPSLDKPTNWKEYLGNQLVAKLDDNNLPMNLKVGSLITNDLRSLRLQGFNARIFRGNLTLPPDDYTRVDYRLVMRDCGKFVCEPNDQGMHGDCFDADKLAGHALTAANNRCTIVPPEFFHDLPRDPFHFLG